MEGGREKGRERERGGAHKELIPVDLAIAIDVKHREDVFDFTSKVSVNSDLAQVTVPDTRHYM